jgi:ribosomal protein S18 acetylase RimI-like enzyme
MLTVWENNEKGQGFYKKYGFTFLEKNKGNVAYGVKL